MHTVKLPDLRQSVQEGKVLYWEKLVGDSVKQGESLLILETEKANLEVESPASGTLRAIFVPEGDIVPVGTPLALVGTADEPFPDPSTLPGPPVSLQRRYSNQVTKERSPFLTAFAWQAGLMVLFLGFFILQQQENWITFTIICLLLVCIGIFIGMTIQRWRSR